jgi:hypothetical protein
MARAGLPLLARAHQDWLSLGLTAAAVKPLHLQTPVPFPEAMVRERLLPVVEREALA